MFQERVKLVFLALALGCSEIEPDSAHGGVYLVWPELPDRVQMAEFGAKAEGSFELEIDFFNADFAWKDNGATKTARFLVPAVVGGVESSTRLKLTYDGGKSGIPVSPEFELVIPGVPVMTGGTLQIEGFAKGMEDTPIMAGEINNVNIAAEGLPEYQVKLAFTDAIDADEDGYVSSSIGGGDCDESDPAVFDGAAETCDGHDTACDGSDDEVEQCAFVDNDGTPMQLIPAGAGAVGWRELEGVPETNVYHHAFYLDRYEISLAKYAECVTCSAPASDAITGQTPYDAATYGNYPVVFVDWNQARTYCAHRNKRLPTEFEWEAAARGFDGIERAFPWEHASTIPIGDYVYANVLGWGSDGPAPVASLPEGKSIFGVYNLMGNAAEWTSSWFDSARYSNVDEALNTVPPPEPASGTKKVHKGGGWNSRLSDSFPYQRAAATTDTTGPALGFRCAMDVP